MKKDAKKLITTTELSKLSGTKINSVARYIRQKLLPYDKQDDKLNRYFKKNKALKRLKEIQRLKEQGLSLSETRACFGLKDTEVISHVIILDEDEAGSLFKTKREEKAYIKYVRQKKKKKELGSPPLNVIIFEKDKIRKFLKKFR